MRHTLLVISATLAAAASGCSDHGDARGEDTTTNNLVIADVPSPVSHPDPRSCEVSRIGEERLVHISCSGTEADILDGAPGLRGMSGPPGPVGADGVAGATGATGLTGATGATGPQGPSGAGSSTAGAAGPAGPAGHDGIRGAPGAAGARGADGTSCLLSRVNVRCVGGGKKTQYDVVILCGTQREIIAQGITVPESCPGSSHGATNPEEMDQ